MKTRKIKIVKLSVLFLFLLVVAQSCVVSSLHPLYTNTDRIHLDELDGLWVEDDQTRYEITTIIDSSGLKKGKSDKIENEEIKTTSQQQDKKQEDMFFFPVLRKHYQIKIISKQDTSLLEGRLSKLNGHYFLDVIPNDKYLEDKLNDDNLIGLVAPMHGCMRVKFVGDKIQVNAIEYDDFEKQIEEKKIRIEYIKRGDRIILTSKTKDIQKFLIKFADTELFNDPKDALILKRLK